MRASIQVGKFLSNAAKSKRPTHIFRGETPELYDEHKRFRVHNLPLELILQVQSIDPKLYGRL